jgi:hypothetical protein
MARAKASKNRAKPPVTKLILNPLQQEVIDALAQGDRYIAVRAGWGSGKTSALVLCLLFLSKTRPGTTILLVTDTARRFTEVLMPECVKWLEPVGWTYHAGRSGAGYWEDGTNGTKVFCVSYHRASGRSSTHNPLEGINVTSGVCLIDECQTLPEEVAVKAFGRLRSGGIPQIVMMGLPLYGAWWELYARKRGGRVILHSSMVNKANLTEGWIEEVENLPISEREAMVYNRPQPPEGQVYREFKVEAWPKGNLTPEGWEYDQGMECRLAADFGLNKPWVGIVAYDPVLDADVLVAELTPQNVTVHHLIRLILQISWPRDFLARKPDDGRPRFLLDAASGDKAGRTRSDQTLRSTLDILCQDPPDGALPSGVPGEEYGIGLDVRTATSPVKVDIRNGILKVKSRILERKLLVEEGVWNRGITGGQDSWMKALGVQPNGNSFAQALMGYKYKTDSDLPDKNGKEDPMDGIRYDVINWHWAVASTDRTVSPRQALRLPTIPTRASRVVNHTPWRKRSRR